MENESKSGLLPAYLVAGNDELKRETVVKRLRERIAHEGDLSFNCDEFDGERAEGLDIVAACNTMPFASNVRLVQVTSADRLRKADQDLVIDYLASPNETTVLCLICAGLAKNTRLYKAVAAFGTTAIIDCAPVKRKDLPSMVRAMATSHGVTITSSAANALVDLVGENTVALDGELQKLALAHRGSDPINDNEVTSLVSRTAEVKPWEFVDAFSERNLAKCLIIRSRMDSVTPYSLMAMCVNRVRELITAQCLIKRGQMNQLPSLLGVPEWRVRNHMRWARGFSTGELRQALSKARDAEKAMKSGADPDETFQDWYVSVIVR